MQIPGLPELPRYGVVMGCASPRALPVPRETRGVEGSNRPSQLRGLCSAPLGILGEHVHACDHLLLSSAAFCVLCLYPMDSHESSGAATTHSC